LPVSFTIAYKVGIAEFYLYVGFGTDLLKNVVTRAGKLPKSDSAQPTNSQTTSGLSHKKTGVDASTCMSRMQNLVKIGKELWT